MIDGEDRNDNRIAFTDPFNSANISTKNNSSDAPSYSLDAMLCLSVFIHERRVQWYNIILHGYSTSRRYRGVNTKRLTHNSIKIRQGGELFHRWVLSGNTQKFITELDLNFRSFGECKQSPRCGRAIRKSERTVVVLKMHTS